MRQYSILFWGLIYLLQGCSQSNTENEISSSKQNSFQQINPQEKSTSKVENDPFKNEVKLAKLIDFEDDKNQQWLTQDGSEYKVIQSKDSGNLNHHLSIDFSNKANISSLTITPEQPWDFSTESDFNLAFDVQNKDGVSIQLYLNVINTQGQYQSRSISLASGYNGTVYIPLDGIEAETDMGLWGDVRPWKTQDDLMIWRSWRQSGEKFDQIASLKFFTIGILEPKSVEIDNIRLRKNPPSDKEWMVNVVDKFGQNAKVKTPLTVETEQALVDIAAKELATLNASTGMASRSKYGGYTEGPKLTATGYFRTEKVNGKWWMVDPEGNIFFSHGPANVRMANMTTLTGVDYDDPTIRVRHNDEITPEDSMGIVKVSDEVKAKRYVISPTRHQMFEWLPEYSDPLAKHYSYRRTTHKGPIPHGETYSFYRANLERRYGELTPETDYIKQWHKVTAQRMQDWGFTSFGNWVDPAFYQSKQVPYFANGWIIGDFKTLSGETNHWGLMPDPFDPVFAQRAKITIDAIANNIQSSPWCVGIFIDNEKSWGERTGSVAARYGVILDAISKNSQDSPAKNAFMQRIQTQYKTVEALNTAWEIKLSSWQEFADGLVFESYNDQVISDLSMLLKLLGEQYFTVVHDTLAQALPNHLYMGARMANWGMPDEIIKASLKYSDVLSFNIYEEGMQTDYWQFLEEVDLPVVVGEFHIGTATDSGLYNPGIVHAANQEDRARMYTDYMQSVLEKPYMVGAHWFQYIDEPISGRAFDGENANIGFVTITDVPYPEMIKAVKQVTSTMYQQRYEQ
ncbi:MULTISPECIES: agarase [unclassified Shewanella]|uniref:agarase n=1 Tax=unclassified Shewanella TaxID=196818 RepID=UPI00354DE331